MKILVAEDDAASRKLLSIILGRLGMALEIVGDGLQVVELSRDPQVGLILMDVNMPKLNGHEATRQIRAREAAGGGHVPIIGLTAHVQASDRALCIAAGMDDCLVKPISIDRLENLVRAWLPT